MEIEKIRMEAKRIEMMISVYDQVYSDKMLETDDIKRLLESSRKIIDEVTPKKPDEKLPEVGQRVRFKVKGFGVFSGVFTSSEAPTEMRDNDIVFIDSESEEEFELDEVELWIGLPEFRGRITAK